MVVTVGSVCGVRVGEGRRVDVDLFVGGERILVQGLTDVGHVGGRWLVEVGTQRTEVFVAGLGSTERSQLHVPVLLGRKCVLLPSNARSSLIDQEQQQQGQQKGNGTSIAQGEQEKKFAQQLTVQIVGCFIKLLHPDRQR